MPFTAKVDGQTLNAADLSAIAPEYHSGEFDLVGDGLTLNTTNLQNAIDAVPDGGTLLLAPGDYLTEDLAISGRSNFSIVGLPGAIIRWNGQYTSGSRGLRISGTCSNITIKGIHFVGDATTANRHVGIWTGSGAPTPNLTDVTIEDCTFEDLVVGVSLDQSGGGSIYNPVIKNCRFRNIVGINSGEGYGAHLASAQASPVRGKILDCDFDQTQRHAIYVAMGSGYVVRGCTSRRHRDGTTDGAIRAAFTVARSKNVAISDCVIVEPNNAALIVNSDDASNPCRNVSITGVHSTDMTASANEIPQFIIGTTDAAGAVEGVKMSNCSVELDGSQIGIECLRLVRGRRIVISDCDFYHVNPSTNVVGMISITGDLGGSGTGDATGEITIRDCYLHGDGGANNMFGVRFNPGIATATSERVDFISNRFNLTSSGSSATFNTPTAITNDEVGVFDQPDDGLTFSAGTYLRGRDFGGVTLHTGAGTPESNVTASPGALYLNESGGAGTSVYVKESGTGNTGWVGK